MDSSIENDNIISDNKIPLNIFQTWIDKNFEPGMISAIIKIKKSNPEFNYYFFEDKDCRQFIAKHFAIDVLDAYDRLIPGAYKADLWRYCVLYIHGGIYLDIKYEPINNFKFIDLIDKEYFVKDREGHWIDNQIGVYNALMITYPKNEILLKCINQIVKNVSSLYYGYNSLYPTGPGLLGSYFDISYNFEIKFSECAKYILFKDEKILQIYDKYRAEQLKYQSKTHYSFLWRMKKIYIKNKDLNKKMKMSQLMSFKPIIPLNIYQVNNSFCKFKDDANLECFNFFNFTLNHCSLFLKNTYAFKHFSIFNKIKTFELKVDLWKYFFLYKNGGIYIDNNIEINFDDVNIITLLTVDNCLIDKENYILHNKIIFVAKNNKKLLDLGNYLLANYLDLDKNYIEVRDKLFSQKFTNDNIALFNLSINENKIYYNHLEIGKIISI